ncbi:protein terminus-like [Musca vetustissima]|uniref:protein terminus-like n=1 Tax=Musca vetustissima TaxID=27455 RepID=UPI002AB61669|nr:protein terminus-like [Musca vetustissima]
MSSMPVSSYTFVTSGGQRRFVHRWQYDNNEVIECNKCGSSCKETDAYGKHWSQPKTLDDNNIGRDGIIDISRTAKTPIALSTPTSSSSLTSLEQSFGRITTLMDSKEIIVSKNVESFMLCASKAVRDTQQFLLDAGIKVVPELLSSIYAMYGGGQSHHLLVVVRFYVTVKGETFMLQTTELTIKHHYDIRESVDMLFAMLLEKLRNFMACRSESNSLGTQEPYSIKRIHIKVRKQHNPQQSQILPLHYARKQTNMEIANLQNGLTTSRDDLALLRAWFRQHLLTSESLESLRSPFPCNLYCFQECPNSLELYVVPYHLCSQSADIYNCRSYIILTDIHGRFMELQEITNIRRFLHHTSEDRVLSCTRCQACFLEPSKLVLHKMLKCGRDFEILKMDSDFIEIYENCLLLEQSDNWSLFGIIE